MEQKYLPRVVDSLLDFKLRTFGAVSIVGPKWCGKTRTAEEFSKSGLYFQSVEESEALRTTASINPAALLKGEQPRLFDEWQDSPEVWDAVRFDCDHDSGFGRYIFTSSVSVFGGKCSSEAPRHTGSGRISTLRMRPMSLFESGESNGSVSLMSLMNGDPLEGGCHSDLSIEELVFVACRGGWPCSLTFEDDASKLAVATDYFKQVYEKEMFAVDGVRRNPSTMRAVMKAYGRNISTLAKKKTLLKETQTCTSISENTFDDYLEVLRRLFLIEEMDGWCPALRSSSGARSGPKRQFVDPSLAVAALGTSPEKLNTDLKTFGFIFESLCVRDLRVYSSAYGGVLSHYHDRYDLEVDCVLHLEDGRYALIEVKLGSKEIEMGAEHLLEVERLIMERNGNESQVPLDLPSAKIVLTGGQYGYKRPDGVYVIPISCLRP